MVDEKILKKKLLQIGESEEMIFQYNEMSRENFLSDKVAQNVVEFNLFIIINLMADIANHICVDNGYGSIENMSDGFRHLNRQGYIDDDYVSRFIKMVGFRNIIAHQYISLNKDRVFDAIKEGLSDIKAFVEIVDRNFL